MRSKKRANVSLELCLSRVRKSETTERVHGTENVTLRDLLLNAVEYLGLQTLSHS
jgi:hypothetical protein